MHGVMSVASLPLQIMVPETVRSVGGKKELKDILVIGLDFKELFSLVGERRNTLLNNIRKNVK